MNAVFSPGFFEGIVGGGAGIMARRWETVRDYYSLCVHSSPLGKEVKQERNVCVRKKKKKKKKNEKERGGEKEEEIRRIK